MEVLDKAGFQLYDHNIKQYIEQNKVQVMDYSFRIDGENLVCDYPEGNEQPDFEINSEGMLVYTY